MKYALRLLSLIILTVVTMMTLSRRDFSGWMALQFDAGIFLMTGDGGSVRRMTPEDICASQPRWSPDGVWVVFFSGGCNGGARDLLRIRPGASIPQHMASNLINVPTFLPPTSELLSISTNANGDALYLPMGRGNPPKLIPLSRPLTQVSLARRSPDGEWIAFVGGGSVHVNIFRIRSDGSDLEQLTERASQIIDLTWSRDGEWLIFTRGTDIYRIRADGSSLQHLHSGLSPQVASFTDRAWHPFGLMTVAILLMVLSLVGRFRQ
jgi:Tol biopolymer transport system component